MRHALFVKARDEAMTSERGGNELNAGRAPCVESSVRSVKVFVVFSSFWNIFVKSHGLRPKSQGFFHVNFRTSRFGGFRGWKVCTMYSIAANNLVPHTKIIRAHEEGITNLECIALLNCRNVALTCACAIILFQCKSSCKLFSIN